MSTRWSKWTFRVVRAWVGLTGAGALLLAACSGEGGSGRLSQPPPAPPPVVTPPAPAKPGNIVLGVIAFEVGGSRVVLRGGLDVQVGQDTVITANGRAATFEGLRRGRVALFWFEPGKTTPTHIDAYDLLVGPLDSVDPDTGRVVVMGQSVVVTGHTAVGQSSVQDGALAALLPGSPVAVSGHVTASGEVLATRIESVSDDDLRLRGLIRSVDDATRRLTIGEVEVDYAQATWDAAEFPAGVPVIGDEVVVRGHARPAGAVLAADSLEYVPRWYGATAGMGVEWNAVITRRASDQEFDVAGRTVQFDCYLYACEDMAQNLLENAEVRFRGTMTNGGVPLGDLVAEDILSRTVSLTGSVSDIDPVTGTLTVLGLRIQLSNLTNWINEAGTGMPAFSVDDLRIGDTVNASGTYGGIAGLLLASSIQRGSARDPEIRGWQVLRDDPDIIMLGRPIATDSTTEVDICGAPSDARTLFSMSFYAIESLTVKLRSMESDPLRASRVMINDGNCW